MRTQSDSLPDKYSAYAILRGFLRRFITAKIAAEYQQLRSTRLSLTQNGNQTGSVNRCWALMAHPFDKFYICIWRKKKRTKTKTCSTFFTSIKECFVKFSNFLFLFKHITINECKLIQIVVKGIVNVWQCKIILLNILATERYDKWYKKICY